MPDDVRAYVEGVASGGAGEVKVYPASRGVRDFVALAMRESTNEDQIDAAIATDAILSPDQKESIRLVIQRERFECAKLSIVALCDADGWQIVDHSIPFAAPNHWSQKAMYLLQVWYQDLNGVDDDDAKKTLAEAVTIGAPTPPSRSPAAGAAAASAARGR
jgi:hypothetical protein